MDRNTYYYQLSNKFKRDLEKLIHYYALDYNRGLQTEFKNETIQDSVDELFRLLIRLNQGGQISASDNNNHIMTKTLNILANFYVLDNLLK